MNDEIQDNFCVIRIGLSFSNQSAENKVPNIESTSHIELSLENLNAVKK